MSDALKRLIDAVEAGTAEGIDFICLDATAHGRAWAAYRDGSLDAGKDLCETLLPGARFLVGADFQPDTFSGAVRWNEQTYEGSSITPARAWLLAILRAYQQVQIPDAIGSKGE